MNPGIYPTMEIQSLLLSDALPNDVVLCHIYPHLWRNRKLLTEEQTQCICEMWFYLRAIINRYMADTSLSLDQSSSDYFAWWLENDLLGVLNDDRSYMDGLSEGLRRECPGITKDFLMSPSTIETVFDKIAFVWSIMTFEKRMKMFYPKDYAI